MNRFILLVLLSFFFCFSACGKEAGSSTGNNNQNNSTSTWILDKAVDEFGDEVEGSYHLKTQGIDASFSNTATTDGELSVVLFDTVSDNSVSSHLIVVRLLEYNNTPATYSNSSRIIVKAKIDGDIVEEYQALGEAPNSDLIIGLNTFDGDKIHYQLKNGSTLKFAVEIDSSKYLFSINGKGLEEACNTTEIKPLEDAATANYEKNAFYPGTEFPTLPFAINSGSVNYSTYDHTADAKHFNVNKEYYHSFSSFEAAQSARDQYEEYLTQHFGEPEKEHDKLESKYFHWVFTDSKGNRLFVSASTKPAVYIYLLVK